MRPVQLASLLNNHWCRNYWLYWKGLLYLSSWTSLRDVTFFLWAIWLSIAAPSPNWQVMRIFWVLLEVSEKTDLLFQNFDPFIQQQICQWLSAFASKLNLLFLYLGSNFAVWIRKSELDTSYSFKWDFNLRKLNLHLKLRLRMAFLASVF